MVRRGLRSNLVTGDWRCDCCDSSDNPPSGTATRCWQCAYTTNRDCRRCLKAGIVVSTPNGRYGHILRTPDTTHCGLSATRARWTGTTLPMCGRCDALAGTADDPLDLTGTRHRRR